MDLSPKEEGWFSENFMKTLAITLIIALMLQVVKSKKPNFD
jgi:hypothetical protein